MSDTVGRFVGRGPDGREHVVRVEVRGRAQLVACETCGWRSNTPLAPRRVALRHLSGSHAVASAERERTPAFWFRTGLSALLVAAILLFAAVRGAGG
ncbi:hypothetical protein [Streptomyces hoynatensis]|nr:hypothetical protein [Streptomyces hoynatensis]